MERYRSIWVPGHPLACHTGIAHEHRIVLYDKIGPGTHPCHWCGKAIIWMPGGRTGDGVLVVDHLDNNSRNNVPENLVPSCHGCNNRRGHAHRMIPSGVLYITNKNGSRTRAKQKDCEHCGKPFLVAISEKRPSRGRFCSRACLGHHCQPSNIGLAGNRRPSHRRALTAEQATEMKRLHAEGVSPKELRKTFRVGVSVSNRILYRGGYKHG